MLIKTGDAEFINVVKDMDVNDETQRKAALNAALELPKSKDDSLPEEIEESLKDKTEN